MMACDPACSELGSTAPDMFPNNNRLCLISGFPASSPGNFVFVQANALHGTQSDMKMGVPTQETSAEQPAITDSMDLNSLLNASLVCNLETSPKGSANMDLNDGANIGRKGTVSSVDRSSDATEYSAVGSANGLRSGTSSVPKKGALRRVEDVDWTKIEDPQERRRQRRLAKNRRTAAISRERRKIYIQGLEEKVKSLIAENEMLRGSLVTRENELQDLKVQLKGLGIEIIYRGVQDQVHLNENMGVSDNALYDSGVRGKNGVVLRDGLVMIC